MVGALGTFPNVYLDRLAILIVMSQTESSSIQDLISRLGRVLSFGWASGSLFGLKVLSPKSARAGLSFLFVLIVWYVASLFNPPSYLPGPHIVAQEVGKILSSGIFIDHMVATLRRVLVGFTGAMLMAAPIGIAMGSNSFAEDFFEVEVIVGVTIPGLIWAMLSIMLFGIQEIGAYFAVGIIVFPMLAINLWEGMKDIDNDLNQMARVFNSTPQSRLFDVVLPQMLPYLFASARFGLGIAWKVVVVIEMLGFSSGVGYKLTQAYQLFNIKGVLAWAVTFTLLMLVIEYGILNYLEKRWLGWRPEVDVWKR